MLESACHLHQQSRRKFTQLGDVRAQFSPFYQVEYSGSLAAIMVSRDLSPLLQMLSRCNWPTSEGKSFGVDSRLKSEDSEKEVAMQSADGDKITVHMSRWLFCLSAFLALSAATLFTGVTKARTLEVSADRLVVTNQECRSDGTVKVWFSWQTSATGDQWLDISATPDNFVSPAL